LVGEICVWAAPPHAPRVDRPAVTEAMVVGILRIPGINGLSH